MFKEKKIIFLIAETPIHAGSGSEVGVVDLPIQRERYTDFPKIESSGLKGCLRETFEGYRVFKNKESTLIECETLKRLKEKFPEITNIWKVRTKEKKNEEIKTDKDGNKLIKFDEAIFLIFGPEGEEAHAGALTLTDAKILLFPVKSLKGVFAWITCPMVLERFRKDLQMAGKDIIGLNSIDFSSLQNTVPEGSTLPISGKVVLEEFTFEIKENVSTTHLANFLSQCIFPSDLAYQFWCQKLSNDLVIFSDDEFTQFVKTSTEIITRTRIDDKTGTVASGALWTEEYLPQDTVLYSIAMFSPPRVENDEDKGVFKGNSPLEEAKKIAEFFEKGIPSVIQIGGNQTIGKGFVRLNLF